MSFMKKKSQPTDPQQELEKKVDEMMYLDSTSSNKEEHSDSSIKTLKIDEDQLNLEPESETKSDPLPSTTNEEPKPMLANVSADTDSELSKEPSAEVIEAPEPDFKVNDLPPKELSISQIESITKDNLDDKLIDQAIDDIVAKESDTVLESEDNLSLGEVQVAPSKNFSFIKILKSKWTYLIILVIIGVALGLPSTRYTLLGLFIKNKAQIMLTDSVLGSPISNATLNIDHQSFQSNQAGDFSFKLPLGIYSYSISKAYYETYYSKLTLGYGANQFNLKLVANGQTVTLKVINKITNTPISDAQISYLKENSLTTNNGLGSIVLPSKIASYALNVSANGYNSRSINVSYQVNKPVITVGLIPAGKIYYLNQSQSPVTLQSVNLDGSDVQTVLPASVTNQDSITNLYPSPDWKYLVLLVTKNNENGLFLYNTLNSQLIEFESNVSNFVSIGWINDQYIYSITNSLSNNSIAGNFQLKSYDALNAKLNILDQSQVNGSGGSYAFQTLTNFVIDSNQIYYLTYWNQVGGYNLNNLNNTIRVVSPDGSNKKDIYTTPANSSTPQNLVLAQPDLLDAQIMSNSNNSSTYLEIRGNTVSADSSLNTSIFNQNTNYYLAPNNNQIVFNSTANNRFVVNYLSNNNSSKILSNMAGYQVVGWYDNQYILLSEGNNLYIASIEGTNSPLLVASNISLNL